jgi:hypothetical protein
MKICKEVGWQFIPSIWDCYQTPWAILLCSYSILFVYKSSKTSI